MVRPANSPFSWMNGLVSAEPVAVNRRLTTANAAEA